MRFSLVVATLGRTTELQRLLKSLDQQTHWDFEIIVVDQNTDDRLLPVLSAFENRMEVRRLISVPGLSRARNVGLTAMTGNIVCFPDDDCCYPCDLLARLNQLFIENADWHGIVGDPVDEAGKPILPWRDREGRLTLPICWRRSISHAIFLRSQVIQKVGGFDDTLGVGSGSPWGSSEDNDIVLRALKAGFSVQYVPLVRVYHPKLFLNFGKSARAKRFNYALGEGKLLQNHPMPVWWCLLFFSVPACRALLALLRLHWREVHFHWLTLEGRLKGFLSAQEPNERRIQFPLEDSPSAAVPVKTRSAASERS